MFYIKKPGASSHKITIQYYKIFNYGHTFDDSLSNMSGKKSTFMVMYTKPYLTLVLQNCLWVFFIRLKLELVMKNIYEKIDISNIELLDWQSI